jgi:hypothetical protein
MTRFIDTAEWYVRILFIYIAGFIALHPKITFLLILVLLAALKVLPPFEWPWSRKSK